jgi:hypothetical protein
VKKFAHEPTRVMIWISTFTDVSEVLATSVVRALISSVVSGSIADI